MNDRLPPLPPVSEGIWNAVIPIQPGYLHSSRGVVLYAPDQVIREGEYHQWAVPGVNETTQGHLDIAQLLPPGESPVTIMGSRMSYTTPRAYIIRIKRPGAVVTRTSIVVSSVSAMSTVDFSRPLRPTTLTSQHPDWVPGLVFRSDHLAIHTIRGISTVLTVPSISQRLASVLTAV